ncbi:hypothetical protein [Clostridium fallax]|uniref:Uncharacterized protein n=1 Tax=Clostridium fallax TaxID=1533 RepID=A0A1M4XUQ7_9CLOT|nr:hypothetical protein [Clostridium fallax]SHE97130.1 hypothetical protein SAMN05443638_12116 [Clostridium fallax]SQB06530.1 membrane protein [Clostridium fallax]
MRKTISLIGILLFIVILIQSYMIGFNNDLIESREIVSYIGILISIIVLIGSILLLIKNNIISLILSIILYAIGGIIGIINSEIYSYLRVWGIILCSFAAILGYDLGKKKKRTY